MHKKKSSPGEISCETILRNSNLSDVCFYSMVINEINFSFLTH